MSLTSTCKSFAVVFALPAVLGGCLNDAQHSNPLDPLAANYVDEGRIEGRILDRSLSAIGGATVTASPGNAVVETAPDGTFVLDNMPSGTYVVTASNTDHAPSIDTVDVSVIMPARVDLELNGLPKLEFWTVNTAHISRWWPLEDLFQIQITAQATDADGVFDLSRVWLDIPGYGFSDTLQVTQTIGLFAKTLPAGSLPTTTIHALLGTPMFLLARDQLRAEISSPALQLVRVIDETPEATDAAFQSGSPDCLAAGAAPLVEWKEIFLPYPFVHSVSVVRVDSGLESLVEELFDIPADSTSANVAPVPAGDYYWTVSVVDNFNNRSRSKQVGFCVTQ